MTSENSSTTVVEHKAQATIEGEMPSRGPTELRMIADTQQKLIFILLGGFVAWLFVGLASVRSLTSNRAGDSDTLINVVTVATAIVSVAFLVLTFRLASAVHGKKEALRWTLGTLIPVIGFFAFVVLNRDATILLEKHGIKVGFMGARAETLPRIDGRGDV